MKKEGEKENSLKQFMKMGHNQSDENRAIKNEDAMFKFLTYSAMLEKNRRVDLKFTREKVDIAYEMGSFDEYYKKSLQNDIKKPPRAINEQDYLEPKRIP